MYEIPNGDRRLARFLCSPPFRLFLAALLLLVFAFGFLQRGAADSPSAAEQRPPTPHAGLPPDAYAGAKTDGYTIHALYLRLVGPYTCAEQPKHFLAQ